MKNDQCMTLCLIHKLYYFRTLSRISVINRILNKYRSYATNYKYFLYIYVFNLERVYTV